MPEPLRLGTRASTLARTQTGLVGAMVEAATGRPWVEATVRTAGDDTSRPLHQPGRPGLFVSALRDALVRGEVDAIVHSFKDLPSAPEPGIALAAVPPREDPRDALVSRDGTGLADLPAGATVGTSSPRRAALLRDLRPDLRVVPIRGNVDSRIAKARDGEVDAVVLALAGLRRIGREGEAAEVLDPVRFPPAPAQGALAVECRADDAATLAALQAIDDPGARIATAAEREVLVGVEATCDTPVAAIATAADGRLELAAAWWGDEGGRAERDGIDLDGLDELGARAMGLRAGARLLHPGDGPRVLLVRSEGNAADADALAARGIAAVADPYLAIRPTGDAAEAERLLAAIADGAMLVATSPMAVPACRAAVGDAALAAAVAAAVERGARAAATGERTAAALRELGYPEVAVPDEASAEALVALLAAGPATRAAFPCGSLALRTLPEGLRALGWDVDEGVVYTTDAVERTPASVRLIADGGIAAVALRSPSAARALVRHAGRLALPVACGGETTAAAAREAGLDVRAVAERPGPDGLAEAVARALG
jgi:hydroxymethylbilane synthase